MTPSREHDTAVGEAPTRASAVGQLAARRKELRQAEAQLRAAEAALDAPAVIRLRETVAVLQQFVTQLEPPAAAEREAEGRAAAQARLRKLPSGVGSLRQEYGVDCECLRRALRDGWEGWKEKTNKDPVSVAVAIEQVNARATAIADLITEGEVLADRFALPLPRLGRPPDPEAEIDMTCAPLWRRVPAVPAFDWDAHHLRQRRTYAEAPPTSDAALIIEEYGLTPWPALTDAQRAAIAEREQDKVDERRAAAEFARAAAEIPRTLPVGGRLGRGAE